MSAHDKRTKVITQADVEMAKYWKTKCDEGHSSLIVCETFFDELAVGAELNLTDAPTTWEYWTQRLERTFEKLLKL